MTHVDMRHLHCRTCGKTVYGGDKIEAIYLEQKKAWDQKQVDQKPQPTTRTLWKAQATQQMIAANRSAIREFQNEAKSFRDEVFQLNQEFLEKSEPQKGQDDVERHRNLLALDLARLDHLMEDLTQVHKKAQHTQNPYGAQKTHNEAKKVLESAKEAIRAARRTFSRGICLLDPVESSTEFILSDPTPTQITGCAWEECPNDAKPNSKYCSRGCSNKNARSRHRKRANLVPKTPTPVPEAPPIPPPVVAVPKPAGKPWGHLTHLSDADLWKQSLNLLRKYARHELNIIGASKIRGGKTALMNRIVTARKGQEVRKRA